VFSTKQSRYQRRSTENTPRVPGAPGIQHAVSGRSELGLEPWWRLGCAGLSRRVLGRSALV